MFRRPSCIGIPQLLRTGLAASVGDFAHPKRAEVHLFADVVRIAKIDTPKASKLLATWRDQGLLEALPGRSKRNMAYTKPARDPATTLLLSDAKEDNGGRLL